MNDDFQSVLHGSPHLNLGKKGITEGVIEHISNLLQNQSIIKIKVMKESADEFGIEHFIREILIRLDVYALDMRGNTFILSKSKPKDLKIPKKLFELKQEVREDIEILRAKTPEPDYIDYDNEEMLEQVDAQSDQLYGSDIPDQPLKIDPREDPEYLQTQAAIPEYPRKVPGKKPKKVTATFKRSSRKKYDRSTRSHVQKRKQAERKVRGKNSSKKGHKGSKGKK